MHREKLKLVSADYIFNPYVHTISTSSKIGGRVSSVAKHDQKLSSRVFKIDAKIFRILIKCIKFSNSMLVNQKLKKKIL